MSNKTLLRNTLALLLLVCVFVYHFGYQVAYFYQQIRVENAWAEKIFGGTPVVHLQEEVLEIPITVAYMPDQEYFQEANTTFEKDGQMFRVVKQRYLRDTLQIIYVPDQGRQALKQLITTWATTQSGEDTSTEGITQIKPTFKLYISEALGVFLSMDQYMALKKAPSYDHIIPASVHYTQVSPPPELMC